MREYIEKIKSGENLSQEEVQAVMSEIMTGKAIEEDVADFLLSLRAKGPTVDEITGAAKIMRQFVVGIHTDHRHVLDTCGTGGDKKNTFNISTVSALVVAGAGGIVAKHGNRSVSSTCGSADILEALGVNLDMEEHHLAQCLKEVGIAFLYAQKLHPAMKNVASVRRQLGVETIFNILGPLTNPANATHQMIGVYSRDLVEPTAHVLQNLGLRRGLVVHGNDGLDEITTTGQTFISEFNGKDVISYDISPEEAGIPLTQEADLQGGNLEENIAIVEDILAGQEGPKRDIVLLNAAYALYISELAQNIEQGLAKAIKSIDSGEARKKLDALKKFTHERR